MPLLPEVMWTTVIVICIIFVMLVPPLSPLLWLPPLVLLYMTTLRDSTGFFSLLDPFLAHHF